MQGYFNVYLDRNGNFTYRSYSLTENGGAFRHKKYGSVWARPGAMLVPDGKGGLEICEGR